MYWGVAYYTKLTKLISCYAISKLGNCLVSIDFIIFNYHYATQVKIYLVTHRYIKLYKLLNYLFCLPFLTN